MRRILTLLELSRLRERWLKAPEKSKPEEGELTRKQKAIHAIDSIITARQGKPVRCALPKKQQRKLGLLPQVTT